MSKVFTILVVFVLIAEMGLASECKTDSNTVILYHLNQTSGISVPDASINHLNGTLMGSPTPTWVNGYWANGIHDTENGADWLQVGTFAPSNCTIEFYFKWDYRYISDLGYLWYAPGELWARGNLVGHGASPATYTITYGVLKSDGSSEVVTTPLNCLLDTNWHHFAFTRTWNGINTSFAIYVDGMFQGSGSFVGKYGGGGSNIHIGYTMAGAFDEIRVSNCARTQFCYTANPGCGDWGFMAGDIQEDCYVNFADLQIVAQNWLTQVEVGDIDKSGFLNVRDYSLFAQDWLTCTDPCNPLHCSFAHDEPIILENSHYQCTLGIGTGLRDRIGIGWLRVYNKEKNANYFNLATKMPIFKIFGDGFALDSFDFTVGNVTINQSGSSRKWQIPLSCASKQINAELVIDINDSDKMNWSLILKNASTADRKLQPVFPLLSHVRIGDALIDNQYFVPWRSGIVGSIDCDLRYEYGDLAWMQVISVFNPVIGAALCTYPKDSNGGFKGIPFKKVYRAGAPTVCHSEIVAPRERPNTGDPSAPVDVLEDTLNGIAYAYYYPKVQIPANGTYVLPDTVIRVYNGAWKEALKDYSDWAHTWYRHVETPQWFKNVFNTVGASPPYYYSDSLGQYTRSKTMGNPDPMHLEQWAGWWDGWDNELPFGGAGDFYYNTSRGGGAAFRNEIQAIQAKGGRVTVYIDNRFCWEMTDIGQAHGQNWAVMDPPGVYATWQKPSDRWMECSYEPNAWVDWLSATCGRIVHDTGMDGIYLDELSLMFPCYNNNHIHLQQDGIPFSTDRIRQFLTKARNSIRQEKADGILMTEHAASDYFTQFCDGSWSQTFYKTAFPFAEQYYDENSLNYFRFCFPEFKLAEWGPSDDWEKRCFFNGIGICTYPITGFLEQSGQMLKENGDAFASTNPEPIVSTRISKVLANKFPTNGKTLYTVYNKNTYDINNLALIEVDARVGYHYVELLKDSAAIIVNSQNDKDELAFKVRAGEVLCIAQLPKIISASRNANTVQVELEPGSSGTLVAFFNYDSSAQGFGDAVAVSLTNGQGQFTVPAESINCSKIILKLYNGELLIDELVMGELPAAVQGTLIQWHLNEGTGLISYDTAGNHDLKIRSPWYWLSGSSLFPLSPYKGLVANSNNSPTYCSSWLNPDDITDSLTVSAWVRFSGVDPNGSIIIAMANKFLFRVDSSRSGLTFGVVTPDCVWHQASAEPLGAGIPIYNDGTWHKIKGVYNGRRDVNGKANVCLYWDDVKLATHSFTISSTNQILMSGGSSKICVGTLPWNLSDASINFVGRIDEIAISNKVE